MYIHVFAFQWKPEATPALQQRAFAYILGFRDTIPGLLEVHAGNNLSPRSAGYTFGGVMKFTDRAAYESYSIHPSHEALLEWLVPIIDAMELDFEA
jgi:hypothetical protein